MALSCDMLGKAESHEDAGGIVVRGAFLQGADWDLEGQCLALSRWARSHTHMHTHTHTHYSDTVSSILAYLLNSPRTVRT